MSATITGNGDMMSLHDQVVGNLSKRFYGKPLINNVYRGDYVEELILSTLGEQWKPIGEWGGWDLERDDGIRLEVKQSAALQSWHAAASAGKTSPSRFDIAPREGYYTDSSDAGVWREVDNPVRSADIYIFAWHPEQAADIADHRRAEQWEFYVVRECKLPPKPQGNKTQTIGLSTVKELAAAVTYDELDAKVTEVAAQIPRRELKANRLR